MGVEWKDILSTAINVLVITLIPMVIGALVPVVVGPGGGLLRRNRFLP